MENKNTNQKGWMTHKLPSTLVVMLTTKCNLDCSHCYIDKSSKAEISYEDKERYAIILFFNKKYNEAANILEDVLKKNTDESVLLRIRGYIAFETGDYSKGLDYMAKFFKLHDPEKNIVRKLNFVGILWCGF